jgi:hypothetical protein
MVDGVVEWARQRLLDDLLTGAEKDGTGNQLAAEIACISLH